MKKEISILLCLLLSCSAQLFAQTEIEPNNSPSTATVMGASAFGAINPSGDVDCFSFQVNQPGVLVMTVSNVPANLALTIHMLDPDLIQWITNSAINGGTSLSFTWNACKPGKHYIRIFQPQGNFSTQQYQVTASLNSADTYECNNDFTEAKTILLNQQITAYINGEGDRDYFQMIMPDTGQLNLSIPTLPSNMRMVISVFDSVQTLIKKSPVPSASGTPVSLSTAVKKGKHYITIEDDNFGQSTTSYKLNSTFSFPTAVTNLQRFSSLINISPNPSAGSFWIDFGNVQHLQRTEMNLYNSKGELVYTANNQSGQQVLKIEKDNLPAGIYLLKLHFKEGIINKRIVIVN
jgi:Secretion system C-terminal sorting domain